MTDGRPTEVDSIGSHSFGFPGCSGRGCGDPECSTCRAVARHPGSEDPGSSASGAQPLTLEPPPSLGAVSSFLREPVAVWPEHKSMSVGAGGSYLSVILTTWEPEIWRITVRGQLGQIALGLHLHNNQRKMG
jgi:hypothetical protein